MTNSQEFTQHATNALIVARVASAQTYKRLQARIGCALVDARLSHAIAHTVAHLRPHDSAI